MQVYDLVEAIRTIKKNKGYEPLLIWHEAERYPDGTIVEQHWQFFHPSNLTFPTFILSEEFGLEEQE